MAKLSPHPNIRFLVSELSLFCLRVGVSMGEEKGEGDAATANTPVLEDFVGSRALRRLVLTAPPPGSTAFGASLWAAALDGRCARWVGTSAEKVLAALVDCPDTATSEAVTKQLKALVKPLSVAEWLAKFKPQEGTMQVKGRKAPPAKEAKAVARTPVKSLGEEAAKTPAKTVAKTPSKAKTPAVAAATPGTAGKGPSPATKGAGERPARKAARKA